MSAQPFPESWRGHLRDVRYHVLLDTEERTRFENDLRVLVVEKTWIECAGMRITDEVKVVIAAQAALLLLNLDHDYYRATDSIFVYPTTFMVPRTERRPGGIVHEGASATLGLASYKGPVVLAWDSASTGGKNAEDGRNVVLHEFAHKLDMLDSFANGTPPLESREQYAAWSKIMTEEYETLVDRARRGKSTLLNKYGATNPAEFFAVSTEYFFEQPRQMRKRHGELYGLLVSYYRQDPASRLA